MDTTDSLLPPDDTAGAQPLPEILPVAARQVHVLVAHRTASGYGVLGEWIFASDVPALGERTLNETLATGFVVRLAKHITRKQQEEVLPVAAPPASSSL